MPEDFPVDRARINPGKSVFHLQPAAEWAGGHNDEPTVSPRGRLTVVLSAHHLLVSLGLYSAMPVLAVVLSRRATGSAGPGLFCFTAAAGLGAFLISRFLARRRYLPTMVAGTVLAAAGFGVLPYADDVVASLALLLALGWG